MGAPRRTHVRHTGGRRDDVPAGPRAPDDLLPRLPRRGARALEGRDVGRGVPAVQRAGAPAPAGGRPRPSTRAGDAAPPTFPPVPRPAAPGPPVGPAPAGPG